MRRGEVWWAEFDERRPVVLLSEEDPSEFRAMQVVAPADTDFSGLGIEVAVGVREGLPFDGVLRFAFPWPGFTPCTWLTTVTRDDLIERAATLSAAKVSEIDDALRASERRAEWTPASAARLSEIRDSLRRRASFLDHPHVRELISLDLDVSDFAFIGSAPLFARGWIDTTGDIDVVARASAWETALRLGEAHPIPDSGVRKVSLFGGKLEILDGWFPERWSADEMIDGADIIYGLRFVSLDIIAAAKQLLSRPKDIEHLRIISEHARQADPE